jgi:hypothetical protein
MQGSKKKMKVNDDFSMLFMEDEHPEALFQRSESSEGDNFETLIVGGGLSGMLLALRLSRENSQKRLGLFEAEASLGGRLFFSSPLNLQGLPSWEKFIAQWNALGQKTHLSGFGLEAMHPDALEALERHMRSLFSEPEEAFFDSVIGNSSQASSVGSGFYLIKKQCTSLEEMMSGSSDIFTRKESEVFSSFLRNGLPPEGTGEKSFEDWEIWHSLPKAQKEALHPIFESLLGEGYLKASATAVLQSLNQFYSWSKRKGSPFLCRSRGMELAIELILRKRNVHVRTGCAVSRILKEKNAFKILTADETSPRFKETTARNVCLALPLARSFSFLSREFLSPSQGRFVSKVRPRSLVAVEYQGWQSFTTALWPAQAGELSRFLFPTEKCHGLVTAQGSLVFYQTLDFENSLQAPAVRDAIGKLRKAACKLLDPNMIRLLSSGGRPKADVQISERLVLTPVGHTLPLGCPKIEMNEVKMAVPGLYCLGDNFTNHIQPWQNIVESVHAVAQALHGSGAGAS